MAKRKKKNKSKKILLILVIIIIAGILFFYNNEKDITVTTEIVDTEETETTTDEVIVSSEAEEIVRDTIQATLEGEDLSTTEVIESTEDEEDTLEEEETETDATVEQENISYDGDSTGSGLSLLGTYTGLTYYSQADSRWASVMYSSVGDTSQTMKSSGCGVTAGAMVVSSSKGTILPTTMAELAVSNGYRTASNGTAWSYFPFIADYFDFEEYYTTSSFDTMLTYLTQKEDDGSSKYYVVASCGSGLFTTGGHYIVLVSDDDGTITVYDPYLYDGKFTTASRKVANVTVSGNSVYLSEESFKTYANYKNFWIFSNDEGSGNPNATSSTTSTTNGTTSVSYTRYVSTSSSNLNVRSGAGTSYNIIGSLSKGTQVTVAQTSGNWSYITSPTTGWVSTQYLSSSTVTTSTSYSTTIGSYYRLSSKTILYSNSSLTGTAYTYLAQTQIKVISHASSTVDYVYVVKTGRYAYCNVSAFTSSSTASSTTSSTVGQYKRLATKTILYSNSSLTGTAYTYLAQTQVKIIKNVSSSVDYVYVVKTGRYAYVSTSAYK